MKERIRQIAEGVIDNPPACRFVPEHLTGTLVKGAVSKKEIEIRTEDGRPVRGVAYSDCPNIRIRQNSFKGYRNHIYIEVDSVGLRAGSTLSGQLVFVTEAGERRLDYVFSVCEEDEVHRGETIVVDFSGKAIFSEKKNAEADETAAPEERAVEAEIERTTDEQSVAQTPSEEADNVEACRQRENRSLQLQIARLFLCSQTMELTGEALEELEFLLLCCQEEAVDCLPEPWLELLQAYVLLQKGELAEAEALCRTQEEQIEAQEEDSGVVSFWLYLKDRLTEKKFRGIEIARAEKIWQEHGSAEALLCLAEIDRNRFEHPYGLIQELCALYEDGQRNVFLLWKLCRLLCEHTEFFTIEQKAMVQALFYGCRYNLSVEALVELAAHQVEEGISIACARLLRRSFCLWMKKADREDETLWTALIRLLEKENCRGEKWYPWLRKAALRNVKSEYLMTAYMGAIPGSDHSPIVRPIVLYYMYGDTLPERQRERLYTNVQIYYREDAVIYGEYRRRIETFMLNCLMHRQINSQLQVLYGSMLQPELLSAHLAGCVADLLSMEHIRVSGTEAAVLQVTYPYLQRRDVVLLEAGEADVFVWNETAQLKLLDAEGTDVTGEGTICRTKWFFNEALEEACAAMAPEHIRYRITDLYRGLAEGVSSAEEAQHLIEIANGLLLQEDTIHAVVSVLVAYAADHPEDSVCDGVLLGADWRTLSATERSQVVQLLSDKGYAGEALYMVRQHGWQELEETVLCALLGQAVQQSAERDQWQIELCVWLYEKGVRAVWLLELLCCYYNQSCDRMNALLKECQKEEYGLAQETLRALTERILIQSLYSSRWQELSELMECYISYGGSSELLLKAYLVVQSYRYYMTGVSDRILEDWISYDPLRQPFHRNMPEICSLAVLQWLSVCKERTAEQDGVCKELLTALISKKRYYRFLHPFRNLVEIPEELAGKVILEYHGTQKKCVRLEYQWETAAETTASVILREYYPGVYCTELMLYAEEEPEYRLYEEDEYQAVVFEIEEPFAQHNRMCELLNEAISAYYHGTVQEAQAAICQFEETAYLCEKLFG